jgi:hypothetical protein
MHDHFFGCESNEKGATGEAWSISLLFATATSNY